MSFITNLIKKFQANHLAGGITVASVAGFILQLLNIPAGEQTPVKAVIVAVLGLVVGLFVHKSTTPKPVPAPVPVPVTPAKTTK